MARLKFFRQQESGAEDRHLVFETRQYEIVPNLNGSTDILITLAPGDERMVEVSNRKHFNCYRGCYIEAEDTGKTVELIRAHDRASVTEEQAAEDAASGSEVA